MTAQPSSETTKASPSGLVGDFTGGLTAAIVALPIALAFGVASGLGAEAGLYAAIVAGFFAAALGGTPCQVTGPTGPMTVVTAALVAQHVGQPELIFAAVMLAGVFQVVLGLARAGHLIEHIPYPVVSGFMSGIGMIIIILQSQPFFGLPAQGQVFKALGELGDLFGRANWTVAGIGIATLLVIYLLPYATRRVPAVLVALIVGTTLALAIGLKVPTIGSIPQGLPMPHLPVFGTSEIYTLVTAGITLAILGSIDSLLTAVIVDKVNQTKHDSNRELIGQGVGNFAAGLIGGLPSAGATMRSIVNVKAGGRTRLSGVLHSLILLAVLMGLSTLTAHIPLACLAAILISVGISIIDYESLKNIRNAPKKDVLVMLAVLLLTIFADLIMAVGVGIALYAMLSFKRKQ